MKRTRFVAMLVLMVAALFTVPGCGGVTLNSEYKGLLEQTATLSQATADRATAGALTPDQMKQSLVGQAAVWQKFLDAANGKASTSTTPPTPVAPPLTTPTP